jgi:hypothetical protein
VRFYTAQWSGRTDDDDQRCGWPRADHDATINVGDTVRWVDDSPDSMPDRWGVVLKISDESQLGRDGKQHHMALIQWERDNQKTWTAPELLVRIEA